MVIFASYVVLGFVDKSFHIYKSICCCWAKAGAFLKDIFIHISQLCSKKFILVYSPTKDIWKSLFYRTFPKRITIVQVPKQPHCMHSFGMVLIFTILSFAIWDHGICFFHYSSNLYVSKQNFIVSSLYVLNIKIFLASTYFVTILKNIFFFLLSLYS